MHDEHYKRLFAFPRMVEDLLRRFVREDWLDAIDFATLAKLSTAPTSATTSAPATATPSGASATATPGSTC